MDEFIRGVRDPEQKKEFELKARNSKSVFYATNKITKTLIKKAKNSIYKKDIVFVSIFNGLENKNFLPDMLPLNTPFVEKKKQDIICTTVYSFSRPFEALQADIAYISFLARSVVDPKLVFVDLFTSKFIHNQWKKEIF